MESKSNDWENLPIWKALYPLAGTYLRLAFKYRDPFFFSNVNPAIITSGLFGESKIKILDAIPENFKPASIFLEKNWSTQQCMEQIKLKPLPYPLVAKPNIGERGFLVRIIQSEKELKSYIQQYGIDIILQEFIDLPEEMAIMYHRLPEENKGQIMSICVKKYLSVIGDGISSVKELMEKDERARKQVKRFQQEKAELLDVIPQNGINLILEKVGNHTKGTTFLNGEHLLNPLMLNQFNKIGQQMEGIFYGRFDLKYNTLAELNQGKNIQIIEFNGVGAEPAHIYDPKIPVRQKIKAYKDHLVRIGHLHQIQKERGFQSISLVDFLSIYKSYKKQTDLKRIPKRKTLRHALTELH